MINMSHIKTAISQGQFQSFNHTIVQQLANRFFPRRHDSPVNKIIFSLVLAVFFALLLLVGLAGNKLFGPPQVNQQILSIFLLGTIYIYILCVVIEFQIGSFLQMIRDNLLGALVKEQDQQRLVRSMTTIFSVRRQFWFGLIFSLVAHAAFIALDPSLVFKFGLGFILANVIFHAFHGFCVYFYIAYLSWAISELKNYQYDLFELDPCSTAIIPELAAQLQTTISIMTLMVASASIIFASTHVLPFPSVAGMVVLMWLSTIALYFTNRYILKSIIVRAKWEKLGRIQDQIREMENKEKIPSKETLDHITQLKEYHDKIKEAPDSPWNFIRFIGTLNTLFWPTFGIIASNMGDFLDLISKVSKFRLP